MKYINKQNGKVMEILKRDEQKGTLLIQFEDGKSSSITTGTLKRWYKAIEEQVEEQTVVDSEDTYVAEVMEQKKELGIECPPITEVEIVEQADTITEKALEVVKSMPAKEVVKEVKKVLRQEKVKKAKAPKEANAEVPKVIDYIMSKAKSLGAEIFAPEKAPKVRAFKVGGHMFARINLSGKRVCLCCRSKAVSAQADQTQKHIFDAIFVFTDLSNSGLIDTLLKESFEYQNNKNTQKEEK